MTGWCPKDGEICKFDGYCCECDKNKKPKRLSFLQPHELHWEERYIFPDTVDSPLITMYEAHVYYFNGQRLEWDAKHEEICYNEHTMNDITIYVYPTFAVHGYFGKSGWIYMYTANNGIGITPVKPYSSADDAKEAACKAVNDFIKELYFA